MAVIAPTPIGPMPPVPSSSDPDETFDPMFETFHANLRGDFRDEANALAANVFDNATDAVDAATTAIAEADLAMGYRNAAGLSASSAATAASTATTKAAEADASAVQASKLNLGPKSSAPAVDNQGAALLAGATYYDTSLSKWRVWSGSAWTDGLSAVAGVASLNGASGALTRTTLSEYGITDGVGTTGNQTVAGNKSFTGNVLQTGSGAIGYGVGSGGSVTQITSKATGVTLNKMSGRIVTHNATLAAGAYVSFTLTNSLISDGDILIVQATGGTTGNEYQAWCSFVQNGSAAICLRNNSAGSLAQLVGIDFAVFKRATS